MFFKRFNEAHHQGTLLTVQAINNLSQFFRRRTKPDGGVAVPMVQTPAPVPDIPEVDEAHFPQSPPIRRALPLSFMKKFQFVPLDDSGEFIIVAMADPLDYNTREAVLKAYGKPLKVVRASEEIISQHLYRWYEAEADMSSGNGESSENVDLSTEDHLWEDPEHLKDMASEAPVIRLVNHLISKAIEVGASDIHIEPRKRNVQVRFRVDGILHDRETLAGNLKPAIISRIKLMAKMDIAEMRLPQDGKIKFNTGRQEVDIRVSCLPTHIGESLVLRLLHKEDVQLELEKLGFGIVGFACTTCNGMSGALDPKIKQEILDRDLYTTAVLSGNRNFDGRIHPHADQAFLASPPLVVAYAIAGTIRFDIEKDVLGIDSDGKPVRLKDIWPSDEEIDAIVAKSVKPEQFRQVYIPMFQETDDTDEQVNPLYDWRAQSTYIRRPPYWEGALAGERTMKGMRPLAILGDNITTDHLSPSNAIMLDSAAGAYLDKMGLPEVDFNSYATHRGDHLTAQRATFANPKLKNEMVQENGEVKQGSFARIEPEGEVSRMWEAIETYMNRKQPLIIVAGADYGQGSSRDWAAKGVRLAGVEVIAAEGFERIHRTNLVGMGVLPLEFKPGTNRKTLNLDGTETYDVTGERTPGATLTLIITRKNGESEEVPMTCRLDTAEEVSIYEAGGVLQRFAQDFLESSGVSA